MSKDYSIDDHEMDKFLKLNKNIISKPSTDDAKRIAAATQKGFKNATKTPLGVVLIVIAVIVSVFFIILAIMGMMSMSPFDYVKFLVVLLLLGGSGMMLYMM